MTETSNPAAVPVGTRTAPGDMAPRDARRRAWGRALVVVLLVLLYLTWWLTDTALHMAPSRYDQLQPGAAAVQQGAEYRLLSLQQTPVLVGKYGDDATAPADAVWVVARFSVTRRTVTEYFTCSLNLIGGDLQTWRPDSLAATRPTESCPPDDLALDQPYEIEKIYVVPVNQSDRLVGIAVEQFNARPDPVLTPPN